MGRERGPHLSHFGGRLRARTEWAFWAEIYREKVCSLPCLGIDCGRSGKLGPALSQPKPWDSHLALVTGLQATKRPRGFLIVS